MNRRHFEAEVQQLIKRGIGPTGAGWGTWLGKYQATLREAAYTLHKRNKQRRSASGVATASLADRRKAPISCKMVIPELEIHTPVTKRLTIENVNLDDEREMDAFVDQVLTDGMERVRAEGDEV